VHAASTITVLSDGSIQPVTAPLQRTGSTYTLTENITFNNPGVEQALRIECSNITFDGNGLTLDNATETCIYIIYATNVTIKNTIVTNAGVCGIEFYQSYNCTVIDNSLVNCNLHYNTGAIHAVQSKYFNVSHNIVRGDGATERADVWAQPSDAGIFLVGAGQSDYHKVANNQIMNVPYGIYLHNSHDNVVSDNVVNNATSVGVWVYGAQDTTFLNNNLSDCGTGISMSFESQSDTISGNTISNSRYYGIGIGEGCQYATITGNNVTNTSGTTGSGGVGIDVKSYGTTVSRNRAINNTFFGIRVYGDGSSVTDNYAADNGEYGIAVLGSVNGASDNYVSRNCAANSLIVGIAVTGNFTEISSNAVLNNGVGMDMSFVYGTRIYDNEILNNQRGLHLNYFGNNSIYHNHFGSNVQHVNYSSYALSANSWDDGYPSGGNYWSGYTGVDLYKGPNQVILGSDGIGDTPYIIAADNVDRYPRMSEPTPGALSVSPNYGGNTGNVTVRITGSSFDQGVVTKLVRAGSADITGSQINIINSTQFTTTFNLVGTAPDTTWDLIVIYSNGTELKLEYAFRVLLGGEPVIYADITGRRQLRIAHSYVYTVRVYNKGNVDATDQLIRLYADPALEILSVKDQTGTTVWNRTAIERTITNGQVQHPELWPGDSSQIVLEFLSTTLLYAPRIGPGDCLTLQVEVYAKPPWSSLAARPLLVPVIVVIVAKVAMETALTHILSQIISSELIYQGVDDLIAEQLRSSSYPVTGSLEVTQVLVLYLLEKFGSSVGAGVGAFGEWGAGALTGLSLTLETAEKVGKHSRREASVEKPIQPVSSYDPNDKAGPTGSGPAAYVPGAADFTYTIYFENLANATAGAEDIVITDRLDTDLDWSTLSMGGSSHPDTMSFTFNSTTGTITWVFMGINLPPNVNPPEGEGWVRYNVSPKVGLATGTEIRNTATIVFDVNPPIATPETLHTIDSSPPESAVQSLPTQSNSSFVLSWSGTDIDSGVQGYSLYYSDNEGPWVVWLLQTQDTSATFNGQVGHTYRFYSLAIDQVGNHEEVSPDPDATTTVDLDNTPPSTQLLVGNPRYVDLAETVYVTPATPLSLTATDNEGGVLGVASTTYRLLNATYVSGWHSYNGAFYFVGVVDGLYGLEYRSIDKNGNTEIAKETDLVLDSHAPEASIVIDNGAASTVSPAITLQLTATDMLQATVEVRLSNDNVTYTAWEVYAPTRSWTLDSGYGVKSVYVQFKDFLGQVSTYSSTIEYISPEFPSVLILPLSMLAAVVVLMVGRRARHKSLRR
jgi:parallel beta-helix repeat protein